MRQVRPILVVTSRTTQGEHAGTTNRFAVRNIDGFRVKALTVLEGLEGLEENLEGDLVGV